MAENDAFQSPPSSNVELTYSGKLLYIDPAKLALPPQVCARLLTLAQ